jgi:dipeptidyl aminopeptidase/acylaminoacyl peptidase
MASRSSLTLIALLGLPGVLAAQAPFTLDLPTIMRGPETVGREPGGVRWTPDSRWIHFSWLPPGTDWRETSEPYRVRAEAGAVPERLTRAQADSFAPLLADGLRTRDGKRKIVSARGDLWVVELPSGRMRPLTRTGGNVQLAGLSTDEQRFFYRDGNNLFAWTLADGFVEQLTDIRPGPAPDASPPRVPAQRAALERDQLDLLAVIRDGARADSVRKAQAAARDSVALPRTYLARDERLRSAWIAPTGAHVLLVTTTSAPGTKATIVPNYVTSSGFTEDINSRTKVGDAQGKSRVGMLTVATGEVRWFHPLPGDSSGVFGNVSSWGWNDAGTHALIQADTREYDRRVISLVDAATGTATPINTLEDTAWVAGPCGSCGGWLPGTQGIWWVNEADGWAHLYVAGADGGSVRQLTRGPWEVRQAGVSDDRTRFELHTSEGSNHERHFWTMGFDGSAKVRWTSAKGGHQIAVSPDGKLLADVHSTSNRPPELFVQPARAGAPAAQLTTSPTPEWLAFKWIAPEIVQIPASDGMMVPARIYRPEQMGATPNGAAVLFVHGAGYLQNVHEWWSTYYREYQFHHLLAQKGYVVLDVDYRASAGYGRDWRTAIYRHMGGRDLEDFVDASKWLTATQGIPGDRIGIYGGSYGGFITLMALFTRPEFFGAGAALRSVTDWAHYNHGYTARILNEPQSDSTAYRRSSPIFFAEGLEDPLLIAHGMIDTNVHFQDVVRLAQRLIELGKDRWEMAVYPVEDHGFVRPDSWTDEYRRILELFDRWLPEVRTTRE